MEAWIAILACFLPPVVLALFPPRTPNWRRARKPFWVTFVLAAAIGAASVAFIDPAGPAVLVFGALVVFATVATLWCYAVAIMRTEWSEWRAQRNPSPPPEPVASEPQRDPTKPWLK
ncbi:hypothetical protein J8F10_02905 [Gemmata sp. G18]|uniref:DUF3325 domain-containing protein n=1 Tax=Gemmata palustris TaxID=2822762 RepID=A0ABS5BKK7_9BACT|nr:hypothetical protein [Gemmata palustris]MBP3954243.1 hypothetical protein [Gemmata palustris]